MLHNAYHDMMTRAGVKQHNFISRMLYTFIVQNEWGPRATHWWASQFSCFSLVL